MTAFRASYADFKIIKTRSVVQVIFEVPIEAADDVWKALGGVPTASSERWFGIAPLDPSVAASPPKAHTATDAGLKAKRHFEACCEDAVFGGWCQSQCLGAPLNTVRSIAKWLMGIASSNELLEHPEKWDRLYTSFKYRDSAR